MLKNQRGITLVALVITIVVLIILATISISFAFGNNGLVKRSEQARDFYANDTKYTEQSVACWHIPTRSSSKCWNSIRIILKKF